VGRPQRYVVSTPLDLSGNGAATFTAPNGTLDVEHVRVTVATNVKEPTATLFIDGIEFEGSYSGSNDQTDSAFTLTAQQQLSCAWVGGDPGATATMIIRGTQND